MKGKFAPTRLAHLLYAKQTSTTFLWNDVRRHFPYKPTPARLSGVMDGILTTIVIIYLAKTLAIVIRCLFVESCQSVIKFRDFLTLIEFLYLAPYIRHKLETPAKTQLSFPQFMSKGCLEAWQTLF